MRPLLAAAAALLMTMPAGIARADDGAWSDLARRIAATDRSASLNVTFGAEPPGFVYPLPERPALPVRGSTWAASQPHAQPEIAHLYYAPTPRTGSASEALLATLRANGYMRVTAGDYPNAGAGQYGRVQRFCAVDRRGPQIDVSVTPVAGVPAMDVNFISQPDSTLCNLLELESGKDVRSQALDDIPGISFESRIVTLAGFRNGLPPIAIVRTALPPAEAVAKIAERWTAAGWSAHPPVVAGEITTQRFSRAAAFRRWDALIVFERRGDGVYELLFTVAGVAEPPPSDRSR